MLTKDLVRLQHQLVKETPETAKKETIVHQKVINETVAKELLKLAKEISKDVDKFKSKDDIVSRTIVGSLTPVVNKIELRANKILEIKEIKERHPRIKKEEKPATSKVNTRAKKEKMPIKK